MAANPQASAGQATEGDAGPCAALVRSDSFRSYSFRSYGFRSYSNGTARLDLKGAHWACPRDGAGAASGRYLKIGLDRSVDLVQVKQQRPPMHTEVGF